ncbi:unnamed protein product [Calypogeia fissa]
MKVVGTIFRDHRDSVIVIAEDATIDYNGYMQNLCSPHTNLNTNTTDTDRNHNITDAIFNTSSFEVKMHQPLNDNESLQVWSNERVMLLGRTGSGKSTIANMLVSGGIETTSGLVTGSSARGVTRSITRVEGRGWNVVDTPGFGEGNDGTMSTREVENAIERFVREDCGVHSHFIYVIKRSRMNDYDE